VAFQIVIPFYTAVFFGLMTPASQRTSTTVFGLVMRLVLYKTIFRFGGVFIRFFHSLSHGTNIKILFPILIQMLFAKGFVFVLIRSVLFFVKGGLLLPKAKSPA